MLSSQLITVQERIEPVFIKDLYAVIHHPQGRPKLQQAVLIVYPIAFEYERCHKALRHLAMQLARRGYLVLRFDYRGTGDSVGTFADWSMTQAEQDVMIAREFLQRLFNVKQLLVVGVRLGANIALRALADQSGILGMVLWSPIVDGHEMLQAWCQHQRDFEKPLGYLQPVTGVEVMREVMGFELTSECKQQLAACRLLQLPSRLPILGLSEQPVAITSDATSWRVLENIDLWWQQADAAVVPANLINQVLNWFDSL